jgi:hypothetical protein
MSTLRIPSIPDPDLLRRRGAVQVDPLVDQRLAAARATHADTTRSLEAVTHDIEQMSDGGVRSGATTPAALEAALASRRAAAIAVERAAALMADAERAHTAALTTARAATVAAARTERDRLQAVANLVTPVLEQLRAAEEALDGVAIGAGDRAGVPALVWPPPLETDYVVGALSRSTSPAPSLNWHRSTQQ